MNDLEKQSHELVSYFLTLESYQKFLIIKQNYENSELSKRLLELEVRKKKAKTLPANLRKEFLENIKKEVEELQINPLYVNYQTALNELKNLIAPLLELQL